MKVCMSFNNIASYRKAIYKMIDKEFDCDWYIEKNGSKVPPFAESELKKVCWLTRLELGPFYWERSLIKLLHKDYDVYFMYGTTRNISLFFFCLLKRLFYPAKRIYFWTHGFYGKESKIELLLWKRPLFRLPDGLFTYGDYAKKIMVECGFDANRIFPIHNSLDYDTQFKLRLQLKSSDIYKKHFKNENPILIFIGRLTRVKRLDMLINAVATLKKNGEEYNVVFVGDGTERETLANLVEQKELSQQVWFYGACYDENENANLVFNADLCVAPGNIGLTAVHCLMFGCPAMSHNNFSMQMPEFEVIKPGQTGDFFEYDDINSIVNTISKWFREHKKDRNLVREACYRIVDTEWNPGYQIEIIKKNLK